MQKEQIHRLVEPLSKGLEAMDGQVRTLEQRREGAYRSLERMLADLGSAQTALRTETVELRQAMKSSSARGRWGELQLRRVVELAGMANHIDFEEQAATDEGRPDMLIHLPNHGVLPVDVFPCGLGSLRRRRGKKETCRSREGDAATDSGADAEGLLGAVRSFGIYAGYVCAQRSGFVGGV